jgi:uncharacterized protein Veg
MCDDVDGWLLSSPKLSFAYNSVSLQLLPKKERLFIMATAKKDLKSIKEYIEDNLGKPISLSAKMGRNKIITRTGVIENAHNSIFIIKLDNPTPVETPNATRRVSYSYTDILTNSIQIELDKQDEEAKSDKVG